LKLLAIDTSTEACSAALYVDGETRHKHVIAPRRHTDLILPMLEDLLNEAGLSLQALDGLAFGRGPGAFTGVRIAAGVIQGIALATGLPVAPVSSMAAMALQMHRQYATEHVLIAIDARMGEVYSSAYRCLKDGQVQELSQERVCRPEQVNVPQVQGQQWTGAGTGWASYRDALAQSMAEGIRIIPDIYPDAIDVALLGMRLLEMGGGVAADQALPVYVRDQVAQRPNQPPV